MKITPIDIQHMRFKTRLKGFDPQEVEYFKEQIADSFAMLIDKNKKLIAEVNKLRNECTGYRTREDAFKKTILNSQTVIEQIKENAKKSAELIVAESEVRAEKILNRTHVRLSELQGEIMDMKRQRVRIETEIRSVIETHSRLLDAGLEAVKDRDEVDSKVKFFRKK